MERQIEISKEQSRVESGNFRDSSCHSEDAQLNFTPRRQNYKQRDKVSSWRRSGKRKACKKRYVFETSSSSSESEDDEVKPVLKYLMKCERKRNEDIKDLFSLVINSKQHHEEQAAAPIAPTFAAPMKVAPKFRKMEEGEDIIVYLEGFEAHQPLIV